MLSTELLQVCNPPLTNIFPYYEAIGAFYFSALFLFTTTVNQMWNGADTLYGNEWIRYDQQCSKIMVAEDGIYCSLRGPERYLPASAIDGSQYQRGIWARSSPCNR